jgi:hypothetical protein
MRRIQGKPRSGSRESKANGKRESDFVMESTVCRGWRGIARRMGRFFPVGKSRVCPLDRLVSRETGHEDQVPESSSIRSAWPGNEG